MTQIIHQVTLLFRGKIVSFPIGEQNVYATSEMMVNQNRREKGIRSPHRLIVFFLRREGDYIKIQHNTFLNYI